MERTVSRGDEWISTDRRHDFDTGTTTTERETSRGGSSEMTRQRNADGSISSEGSITTGGGKEYDVQREINDGTRTSTITGDSGSVTTETRRQNGQSVTSIEGSGGGQGISVKDENGSRTTIGQSGSGDIYAGRDGEVFKKTDDGWQHYDNGGWQDVERPGGGEGAGGRGDGAGAGAGGGDRPSAGQLPGQASGQPGGPMGSQGTSVSDVLGQSNRAGQTWEPPGGDGSRASQLDRDYSARQRSQRQYDQRRSMDRGGFNRGMRGMGGGFRGGMRGGGRRR
jgi:hypothetical protein